MALHIYFSKFIGDGLTPETAYRTVFHDLQPSNTFKYIDMRQYEEIDDGYSVIWSNNTDTQHSAAIADSNVTYLAFEDSAGNVLPLTSQLSAVDSTKLTAIKAAMEAAGIPTDGITLSWTIGQALRQIQRRIVLKIALKYLDFDDLTATVSSLPALKLKAIKRSLTNHGLDVSGITGGMTLRAAILDLYGQTDIDNLIASMPSLSVS